MDFGKIVTAMVTPFDEQMQVNWSEAERLIDYLIEEQQTDSLVICGTTGESPTLTEEEKLRLFETAVRHAGGRAKIIAGTGSYDTAHSIHLSKLAKQTGVDGLLLVAPYYNRPSTEGIYQHFKAIADAVDLPIMLYNIPSRTNVNMSAELTLRLAQIPNIVAMKESSGDLNQMTRIIAGAPSDFYVYSGDDNLTLPLLAVGGHGIVSVASHVAGKQMKRLIEAYSNGQVREAAKLHQELLPIFEGLFNCPHRVPNPVPVKHALRLRGFQVGSVRLPLIDVTEQEGQFIQSLLG